MNTMILSLCSMRVVSIHDLLRGKNEVLASVLLGGVGVLAAKVLSDLARRELSLAHVTKVPRQMYSFA